MSQSVQQNSEESVVGRLVRLPLFSSALEMASVAYAHVKSRYALADLAGGVAELSIRSVSQAAARQATPVVRSLEPHLRVANSYASVGLDQLEKRVPILHQSVEEVMGHLKDALFLTLDDLQIRVNEELDRVQDGAEWLVEGTQNTFRVSLRIISTSFLGTALTSGLDNLLTYSEESVDYFLHLPPELQRELELRIQQYEEDNDEEEPGTWTRVRGLLLYLSLYLYHRTLLLMASLQNIQHILGGLYDMMGLNQVVEAVLLLSQRLVAFTVAQGHQLVALKDAVISQLSEVTRMNFDLPPISQALSLPGWVRDNLPVALSDLQVLSKLLLQLLINTTPLYNMLQRPSEQQLEDYLIQEYLSESSSPRRASVNSLLLKMADGRPRRRRSLYARFRRGSSGPGPANGRRGSLKEDSLPATPWEPDCAPSTSTVRRRSSATEVLLAPIKQLVSQGQRALEYLSPTPHQEETEYPEN
ncbi:perilipin 6 [Conger conger]|uniref:perilipin 6 n=1 Tax=Conger conger TaxID=82655 RepID=UPI002A5A7E1E|nr:perilipin 6 [Conger conger]